LPLATVDLVLHEPAAHRLRPTPLRRSIASAAAVDVGSPWT
jgi:hypothetical protein